MGGPPSTIPVAAQSATNTPLMLQSTSPPKFWRQAGFHLVLLGVALLQEVGPEIFALFRNTYRKDGWQFKSFKMNMQVLSIGF